MLTSVQNDKVKAWYKLKNKKNRKQSKTFLIEGFHLIEEVHKSEWEITEIILLDGVDGPGFIHQYPVTVVSSNVCKHLSDTRSPQGIAAVVKMKDHKWGLFNRVLMIDTIQDPGNAGTMIRTADAAGFDAVILGENTVDIYNEKVIRSTQGSLFHIPVFQENLLSKLPALKNEGYEIWAAALENSIPYKELNPAEKSVLIVGNEGAGIQKDVLKLAGKIVKIPIYGQAESLNVSVAAGILMYYMKA